MLIKCEECGGQVSNKAKSCPHCGAPVIVAKSMVDVDSCKNYASDLKSEFQGESIQGVCQAGTESNNIISTLEASSGKYNYKFIKYFLELIVAIVWAGVSFVMLAVITKIIPVNLFGIDLHDKELRFLVSIATSPIYFVLPIEWMICKWNTCHVGHIIGNVLLCFVTIIEIIFIFGFSYTRYYRCATTVDFVLYILPLVVTFASIYMVVSERKYINQKNSPIETIDSSAIELPDRERAHFDFDKQ